jgi:hypothetical protein
MEKGKGKPVEGKKKAGSAGTKVTVTGPAGRERRRNVKLGEQERRRARDEKFGMGPSGFSGVSDALIAHWRTHASARHVLSQWRLGRL